MNRASIPGAVFEWASTGRIVPLLHHDIVGKYEEVLQRPKFHFDEYEVAVAVAELVDRALFVDTVPIEEYILDPKDVIFYEVVMSVKRDSDSFLVTGDFKDFPVESFIVTPKQILDIISKNAC